MNKSILGPDPKISIIIPVYNVEQYLGRCMESVLNQTYKNIEVILIDDGSKDRSSSMCDEWKAKDDRVVVIHQKNAGAGAARNAGLAIANGELIGFVDSDDWIQLNMYETLINAIKKYPETDIAECKTTRTDGRKEIPTDGEKNVSVYLQSQTQTLENFFRIHGGESNYGIYTKLIKRKVLDQFKFVEGTISEDVMASYYFYTHCEKVVKIDKKLYNYFQNQEGVTRKSVSKRDLEYIDAFERIHKDVKKKWPELAEYSQINYARANFTILGKMKLCGYDKADVNLTCEFAKMKKIVRQNFKKLLFWKMSVSRKILLIWVCI